MGRTCSPFETTASMTMGPSSYSRNSFILGARSSCSVTRRALMRIDSASLTKSGFTCFVCAYRFS